MRYVIRLKLPNNSLNLIAHVFHDYNLAFILSVAVLELWLIQHWINCEQFYFFYFNDNCRTVNFSSVQQLR